MIDRQSTSRSWIEEKVKEFKKDPILIEKVVRALILLEKLQSTGLKFIFKGGTALMLLTQEPRRFSIDIDIIMESKPPSLEEIFDSIVSNSDFTRWEEDERKNATGITKQHFKFYYSRETAMRKAEGSSLKEQYILLDVVYHENPYDQTQNIAVSHALIKQDGRSNALVTTPTFSTLLGDKLTAFAPHTTGIPLTKEMEVLKQVYDINELFDRIASVASVNNTFHKTGLLELKFRQAKKLDTKVIINDILSTSFNFCSYGSNDKEEYRQLLSGLSKLNHFIYGPKFREPEAQTAMAKAAYLALSIDNDFDQIKRYDRSTSMKNWTIVDSAYSKLNRLKKSNPEAFFYWYKTLAFIDGAGIK